MKDTTDKQQTPATSEVRVLENTPPDERTGLIREYPGLAIAAGLGLGLLAGALLPRSAGRKLVRVGVFAATTLGEMSAVLGKQALDRAGDAAEEGRERVGEYVGAVREKAGDVVGRANDAGHAAGDNVQRLAAEASLIVRELGEDLAKKATASLAKLRN